MRVLIRVRLFGIEASVQSVLARGNKIEFESNDVLKL